eukprot:CAMPEP_0113492812 /NCGR_PEP_ID=MMETSP0014_2-20120614/28271_1 /TAXON_ID=2857 /ORGANISM="Nitzschia sp." /LENGTH=598 /DNA_ID=CAMNT_0000386659 /DNA_START=165 /DNA_END=1961 /DNA_ORIENTATION=- /assembly_acc=CAM_ASM_000159
MENQQMTMTMSNSMDVIVGSRKAGAAVAAIADDCIIIGSGGDTTGTTTGGSASNNDSNKSKSGLTLKGKSITINGSVKSSDLKEHDVVCEKGRGDHERWPGNKLYRHLVNQYKETYNDLPPVERSSIIGKIISSIQEKDGWFVQHNDKAMTWTKLTEEKVRKKVSDDLRREIRRRREKRSHNSVFSTKLRAIKKMEDAKGTTDSSILDAVCDPQPADVLFGPGARRHPGNKMYWNLMKMNLDQYIISPYGARSVISRNIVQCVSNQLGRFLEQDPKTGTWYHISGKRAIEKTSHALSNMKYKTRKSAANDINSANNNNDPIDFRLAPGSFEDMMAYDDDDFSEEDTKILDTDSPHTVFAKKRTKKFRFLSRRMDDDDDNLTLESKGSLKSAGSMDGLMMLKNHHGHHTHQNYHPTLLSTPPVPGMTKLPVDGKIISPNDHSTLASKSEETRDDYHDYQEQQTPNGIFDGYQHHHRAPGFPDGSEFGPIPLGSSGYNGNMPAADIGPRPSQYDAYLKGYGVAPPYKPLSYDFAPPYPHQHNARGYNYGSAYSVGGGGHGMASHHLPLHQQPMANDKSGGYWNGNDWASQQQQRVDGGYY